MNDGEKEGKKRMRNREKGIKERSIRRNLIKE